MWFLKQYDPLQAGSIDGTDIQPHDAGLERAALSHYRPPTESITNPLCTLFVGRLSFETDESCLKTYFEQYGEVSSTIIIRNNVTGLSQGYGFVTFVSKHAAEKAYKYANKTNLNNRTILVDYERSRLMKSWKPRRLGGGFGGRKESGQLRFGARDRPFRHPASTLKVHSVTQVHISKEQERSDCWRSSEEHDRGRRRTSRSASRTSHSSHTYHTGSFRETQHRRRRQSSRSPSSSRREHREYYRYRERSRSKSSSLKRKRYSRHRHMRSRSPSANGHGKHGHHRK
ncbi:hypothetical protein BDF20DRAFT_611265 [Mycotypha africana]|uniref:uncharacterized protein n=1 Tax=Mycotypha africana TaxID=64632 RepID=UPI002300C7FD|nr:uncharacterized protein BDF20DRAFT_611265 [Mycotypha africana]KAI8975502.1 hypothetical protein BDF20DRAFT_611265 [Mycotypha africana]